MDAVAAARKNAATDARIKNALLRLMENTPYHEISVPDIVLAASTARCTFYRHFATKDALLLACCTERFEGLYKRISEEESYTFHETSLKYFSYWMEHLHFLKLLQKQNLLSFFTDRFNRFLDEVIGHAQSSAGPDAPPAKVFYHFYCSMSAMSGILVHWLNTGCKESAEQLSQFYVSFLAEGSADDPDCRYYRANRAYPFDPSYV